MQPKFAPGPRSSRSGGHLADAKLLLFGPPLPGYDAQEQQLVDAAQAAMNQLIGVLHEFGDRAGTRPVSRSHPSSPPGCRHVSRH